MKILSSFTRLHLAVFAICGAFLTFAQDTKIPVHATEFPVIFHGVTERLDEFIESPGTVNEITKTEKLGYNVKSGWNTNPFTNPDALPNGMDPAYQTNYQPAALPTKAVAQNWDGMGYTSVNPADPSVDVGPNHVVQMINGGSGAYIRIYTKTGTPIGSQVYFDNFMSMPGGAGDPIVMYDERADRWFLSEFSSAGNNLHVAISTTPDPGGTYYKYTFNSPGGFPDYPKYSIWENEYVMTANVNSPDIFAMNRTQMLAGSATTAQQFNMANFGTIGFQAATPVSLNGTTLPPSGAPAMLMRMRDDAWSGAATDALEMWNLSIDWVTPANSALVQVQTLAIAPHDSGLCGYTSFQCFPQPGTSVLLDPLRELLMNRIHYRNFGTHESIVCCHVTDVNGADWGGIRWYELRRTGGTGGIWTIYQQGTYAPDSDNRWMASIGISATGKIGLAYSVSSSTTFPSLRYTGRRDCDPLGVMTEGETTIIAGTASNGSNRWGDYFQMGVDPSDGETFYHTGCYNTSSSWKTRISAFNLPSCSPPANDDAGISAVITPTGTSCSATFIPEVTLRNFGGNTLSSCTILYNIDGATNLTYNWTGSLASLSSVNVTLPSMSTSIGAHTFNVTTSLPNGTTDNNIANDGNSSAFTISGAPGATLPISEGFVSTTFPPTGWGLATGTDPITWARVTTAGIAPTAGNSAKMNCFNAAAGDVDDLIMLPVNLTGYSSVQLTFDVAHRRYSTTTNEKLEVVVYGCGVSTSTPYSKTGATLATVTGTQTTAFTPSAAQWRNETVDLTPFIGNQEVFIAFRSTSDYGNNIYIDNVNLTGITSSCIDPTVPVVTSNPTTTCTGGTVTLNISGTLNDATAWNIYTGSCGGGTLVGTTTGSTFVVTPSGPSTTYFVRGEGGCVAPGACASVTVSVNSIPTNPVVTVTNNCGNSVLTATGSGLVWSTGATTASITVATAGTYTVTQTVGGCTSAAGSGVAAPIAIPSAPVVTVTNNCGNSVLSATGSGLVWSTGATTSSITVPTAGTYTVTQTVGGCISAAGSGVAAPIAFPSAPVVTVTNNCGNSVLSATGTGLLWSTGATTASITVPTAGTYTVTQTVGGCTSTSGSGIAAPLVQPAITQGTLVNPTVCGASNGSITVNGTGTGDISWSGAATGSATGITLPFVITNLSAGAYSIIYTASCPSTPLSISLVDPTAPSAPVVTVTNNCGNSVLTATGTGLLWSTGATTSSIAVTSAGTYTVTQTVGGCTSAAGSGVAAPIAIPSAPVVTVINNCGNSLLSATGSGLLWSTGETTSSITVPSAGTYSVTQTVGGCLSSAGSGIAAPIVVPSAPVVTVIDNCGNSVLASSGTGLLWSTGATTSSITVTSAGTYTVTQTVGGCTSSAGAGVAAPSAAPSAPVVTVTDNCGNSVLTASGSGTFLWSNGATTASITVSVAGAYTVTQTVGGCTSATGSGIANPAPGPSAPLVTVVNNCGNSILTASGTGPYVWSTGETTGTITVSTAGTYAVTETIGGCTSAEGTGVAAPIAIPSTPVITVLDKCGISDLMTSATGSLMWSTSETTSLITVTMPGTYFVSQTVNGCTSAVGSAVANPNTVPTVIFAPLSDICINAPAYTLVEGSPAGGVYSGTGVAGGQFDPSVSGYGVFTIVYNYIDANGCSGSNQQPITVGCADVVESIDFSLSIFPNPTTGLFVVKTTGESIEKIRVVDAAGRIVQSIDNLEQLEEVNVDLTKFSEGVYSVEIEVGATILHELIILTK
jgi:hypothetical protein